MTAQHIYVLLCDRCSAEFYPCPRAHRAFEAREAAAASGWEHIIGPASQGPSPSRDYCDTCAEERTK